MKKARVIAVCTVGLVLALLLGGLPNPDPIHSAVNTGASVVYAAYPEVGTPISSIVIDSPSCKIKAGCRVTNEGFECYIEIECTWE